MEENFKFYADTSALILLLEGKLQPNYVAYFDAYEISISQLTLLELADYSERRAIDISEFIDTLIKRCTILAISQTTALKAAKLKSIERQKMPKFGIIDAAHYTLSQEHNLQFLTSDRDFKTLPNVTFAR
jgi:predicted nucleic acid-binding protein